MGADTQSCDGQQRPRQVEHFVVLRIGRHVADEVDDRRIRVLLPDERDQGQVQHGHVMDLDPQAAGLGNPFRNPQGRIQSSGGIDLNHHLESRLKHVSGNHGVGRPAETALVDAVGEPPLPAGDILHVRLLVVQEEPRAHRGNAIAGGLTSRHEYAEQRIFVCDERNRVNPATAQPASGRPLTDSPPAPADPVFQMPRSHVSKSTSDGMHSSVPRRERSRGG